MSNYYLEHYGVVGMKWGKRKTPSLGPPVIELGSNEYRFTDGSRAKSSSGFKTSSSSKGSSGNSSSSKGSSGNSSSSKKAQSNDNSSTNAKTKKANYDNSSQTNNQQSTTSSSKKTDLKSVQTGLKDGKKIVDAGSKYLEKERTDRNTKTLKAEAKNMTDEELKSVINRLSMEERYVSVMEKQGVGESKNDLQKTLEMIGTAVSYADTALDIYDKIQSIRSR